MNEQLVLLRPDERPWRLDEHTREIGRKGVQEARAALRQNAPARRRADRLDHPVGTTESTAA